MLHYPGVSIAAPDFTDQRDKVVSRNYIADGCVFYYPSR